MARRYEGLDVHGGRVLLLLRHFGPTDDQPLDGLTKLAKLDFLLRYPVFTERLLIRRNQSWAIGTEPSRSEELAVESRMIRYKYGPWDDRYYPILGSLAGLALIDVTKSGRSFKMSLTVDGRELTHRLAAQDEWSITDRRAEFLRHEFDMSGSKLKNLIYTELPDVVDRPLRSVI